MRPDINASAVTTNPLIERIRKALARAKDQEGTPEGETAARIARNMMDAHAISMADIDVATAATLDPLIVKEVDTEVRAMWSRTLLFAIARHCTCRGVATVGTTTMRLYGYAHDVAVAEYLFGVISRQLYVLASANSKRLTWLSAGEKRTAYNTFMCSAVEGVCDKLTLMQAEAQAAKVAAAAAGGSAASTSMVLVAREETAVAFFEKNKGRTKQSPGMRPQGFDGAGYNAGRSVSLNAGIAAGAGSSRRLS